MLRKIRFLYNDQPDATGGQGAPPTPAAKEQTPAAPPEGDGGNDDGHLDFYGKQSAPEATPPAKADPATQPEQAKPPADVKPVGAVAGYDSQKEPEVDPPPPPAPPEPPKSTKEELGYELDLKDVDEAKAKQVVDFAKTHKLSEEVAKAMIENVKIEAKAVSDAKAKAIADHNAEVKKIKAAWHKELKEHKDFGGDKFEFNLGLVAKVLDLMPEVKEDLTKSGNMLPPKVMRGLKILGDQLFKTEEVVMGDPPASGQDEAYDPLSYYKT